MKLTKSTVERLPIPDKESSLFWDDDLAGFGVRVWSSGKRSYIVQGRANGKSRRVVIRSGPVCLNSDLSILSGISADSHAASLTVGSITA